MVFSILVHNGQTFGAFGFGAGFRNINNTGVKVALFAGEAFINRIGYHVGNSSPVVFGGGEGLSFHLILGINIP